MNDEKPKLIYFSSRYPWPLHTGDRIRAYHQIRFLSRYFRVCLIALDNSLMDKEQVNELKPYCFHISVYTIGLWSRMISVLRSIFSGTPIQVNYFYNPLVHERIREELKTHQAIHSFTHLMRMSLYSMDIEGIKALDLMDSARLNDLPGRKLGAILNFLIGRIERRKELDYERRLLGGYNPVFIISARDRESYSDADRKELQILPNGIDTNYFRPLENFSSKKFDLVFCGNMRYEPNVRAARFFVREILPLLDSEITCLIGGIGAEELKLDPDPRLAIYKQTEDLRSYYQQARIFIAPVFTGSGMQNKVLEAMAQAIPVITTSFVNAAILGRTDENILIADNAQEFVLQISRLLSNSELYARIARNARDFVESNYNWDEVLEPLRQLI